MASAEHANQVKFAKQRAALLSKVARVPTFPRANAVAAPALPENPETASRSCKAVIEEWKATQKK